MNKFTFFFLITLILFFSLEAAAVEQNFNLQQGKEFFYQARKMFYNRESSRDEVIEKLLKSKQRFSQLKESTEKYCWLARVNFLHSDIDKEGAKEKIYDWQKAARKALELDESSSEAHALLGNSYLLLVPHVNYIKKAIYAHKALNLLKRAIELDDNNYLAYHSLGVYHLMAPSIIGGDLKKGINYLNQGRKSEDRYIKCLANFYLGYAYQEDGKLNLAVEHVKKALEIYPNNPNIREYLRVLQQENS